MPAGKEHKRQGNDLSCSCHTAWRLSPCPKAPLGCRAPGITPAPSSPSSPSHPLALVGELDLCRAEAAEKYRHHKRARFLPEGSSGARRVTRAPARCGPGTDLKEFGCAKKAQPRLLGSCSIPRAPRAFPLPSTALRKPRCHARKQAKRCNPWEGPALRPEGKQGTRDFAQLWMLAPDPGCSGAVTQAATTLLYFLPHQATPAAQSRASPSHAIPAPGAAVSPAGRHWGAGGSARITPARPSASQPGHVSVP